MILFHGFMVQYHIVRDLFWSSIQSTIALNMAADGTSSILMTSGGDGSAVETKENTELERIKKECTGMINTLKALHDEEKRLREGNQILAQQAVIMGCTAGLDAAARRGVGRKRLATSSATSIAASNNSAAKRVVAVMKPTNNTVLSPPGFAVKAQGGGNVLPSKIPVIVKLGGATTTRDKPNVREKCEQILKVIGSHGIFTNLTHPARVAEGFVDLTIHMRVIQKKIETNAFTSSFDLFKADVRQMFDSSLRGNKEGSQFYDVIKELRKTYEFTLANIHIDRNTTAKA